MYVNFILYPHYEALAVDAEYLMKVLREMNKVAEELPNSSCVDEIAHRFYGKVVAAPEGLDGDTEYVFTDDIKELQKALCHIRMDRGGDEFYIEVYEFGETSVICIDDLEHDIKQ
ncbi:MAG: hypothetical protein QXS54_06720 [Candidatus Methanomethylicaceae archaeon]